MNGYIIMKQEKNQLKIGIMLNYINLGVGNLIPIFYTPIMLALLGKNEYGLYKLSSNVTSYLSLISLGIGSAVTRYLIKAYTEKGREEEERYLGLFMIIFQIIAIIAFILGIAILMNLDVWYGNSLTQTELYRMKILVFLMTCNMTLNFSQTPYLSVVTAHEKFIFLQCINIFTTCLGPALNIIVLFLGYASIGMAMSTLAIGIICRIVYCGYVKYSMRIRARYRNLPFGSLKEILFFSFWIFIANVVGQLYNATDTVMIGAVPALSTVGVAVFNVGNTFNNIVFSLTTGISNLLIPKANKMVFGSASNRELTDLSIKVGRLQCYIIALVVTGFIAFGRPFIYFYAGEGYSDAYWVAILLMVPNMIPLVQSMCLSIIVAQNRHRFRSLVYLGIAIVNVIGTWFLMKVMGIIGAAFMTGLALILGQGIVMNWYYHKKTGLDMIRFWKELGKVFFYPCLMCVITLICAIWIDFYNTLALIVGIIMYTAIYLVIQWVCVMNSYEKSLCREPLNAFIARIKKKKCQNI